MFIALVFSLLLIPRRHRPLSFEERRGEARTSIAADEFWQPTNWVKCVVAHAVARSLGLAIIREGGEGVI